jgi:hypothetical protein
MTTTADLPSPTDPSAPADPDSLPIDPPRAVVEPSDPLADLVPDENAQTDGP